MLYIIIGVVVVCAVVAVLAVIMNKKKKNKSVPVSNAGTPANDRVERTEIVGGYTNESELTEMLIDKKLGVLDVRLIDIADPSKVFQMFVDKTIYIGRKINDIDVHIDYDTSISGIHCTIFERGGDLYIKDEQSSNGTFINENRITSEEIIFDGDEICLGRLKLKLEIKK